MLACNKPTKTFVAIVSMFAFFCSVAFAQAYDDELFVHLDQATVARGYTVSATTGDFSLGIFPGVLTSPATVRLRARTHDYADPAGMMRVSVMWEYAITMDQPRIFDRPLIASFALQENNGKTKYVAFFNRTKNAWQFVPAQYDSAHNKVRAFLHFPYVQVAVFERDEEVSAHIALDAPLAARSVIVMDVANGHVLFEKNADAVLSIASLTKLATAKTFLAQSPNMQSVVALLPEDQVGGAHLYSSAGETLSLRDAFYMTLVGSANNTARLLARSTEKNDDDFIAAMNAYARSLGLTHTVFQEPTGLSEHNVSTAREYALLALDAFADSRVLQATTTRAYEFTMKNTGIAHTVKTTNKLATSDLYVTGAKTGYTDEAGYCFILKAKDRVTGSEVLVVVLGASTSFSRFDESYTLATKGLAAINDNFLSLQDLQLSGE